MAKDQDEDQNRWVAAVRDAELKKERTRFLYKTAFHTYIRAMMGALAGYFVANIGIFFYYWTGPKDETTLVIIQIVCCLLCAGPHLVKDLRYMSDWLSDFDHEHGFVATPRKGHKASKPKEKVMTGLYQGPIAPEKREKSPSKRVLKAKYVLKDDEMIL